MKVRLVIWPVTMAYMCFLIAGNGAVEPIAFTGSVFGALLGVACALVFFRRAKRHEERELARLLSRY